MFLLIIFSYDVIVTSGEEEILNDFKSFNANVVFSAEKYCWPDSSLEQKYPQIDGKRYLNSGGFIGYAPIIYEIITSSKIDNADDDQLFYTKIYLNENLRSKYNIVLDNKSKLFQNLNGAFGEIELKFKKNDSYIENNFYKSKPKIIHGNGQSKIHLNLLGNYLAKSWTLESGCITCNEDYNKHDDTFTSTTNDDDDDGKSNNLLGDDNDNSNLKNKVDDDFLVCLFIEHPTPFLEEFFQNIERLNLSKDRMSVRIHNSQKYHRKHVQDYIDRTVHLYRSIKLFDSNIYEWQGRNLCL